MEQSSKSKLPPVANGGGRGLYDEIEDDAPHTYERTDEGAMAGYEMPRSSTERSVTPDEVRKGVRGKGVCILI